jgi:hypothetical protein
VTTYTSLAAQQLHNESTFGAPAIDNVSASVEVPVRIRVRPDGISPSVSVTSNGDVTVGVFGQQSVQMRDIDWGTVRFGLGGMEAGIAGYSLQDLDGDGFGDAVLRFRVPQTRIDCGTSSVVLRGETIAGIQFSGVSAVIAHGCK